MDTIITTTSVILGISQLAKNYLIDVWGGEGFGSVGTKKYKYCGDFEGYSEVVVRFTRGNSCIDIRKNRECEKVCCYRRGS